MEEWVSSRFHLIPSRSLSLGDSSEAELAKQQKALPPPPIVPPPLVVSPPAHKPPWVDPTSLPREVKFSPLRDLRRLALIWEVSFFLMLTFCLSRCLRCKQHCMLHDHCLCPPNSSPLPYIKNAFLLKDPCPARSLAKTPNPAHRTPDWPRSSGVCFCRTAGSSPPTTSSSPSEKNFFESRKETNNLTKIFSAVVFLRI